VLRFLALLDEVFDEPAAGTPDAAGRVLRVEPAR